MATVRKRRPNDPKSPWVCAYTDAAGKRRLYTPKTGLKKDADAFRRKIEAEIERGDHVAISESATVASIVEMFMRHQELRLRDGLIGPNRQKQLDQIFRLHITPVLGRRVMSELQTKDVEAWHEGLWSKPNCSPASRSIYIEAFRRLEDFAFRKGLIRRKPVRDMKVERGSGARKAIETFSIDDARKLLEAVEIRQPFHRRMQHDQLRCTVYLGMFCGLRRGEIFGLTRSAVDLERRVVHVRQSLTVFRQIKGPKTPAGKRDVPMPRPVYEVLRSYIKKWHRPNADDLIFLSETGSPAHATTSHHYLWRKLLVRAGLHEEEASKGYHFHALRHFAASAMIQKLAPPDVAKLMGHKTFDMTLQVYAHPIYPEEHRRSAMNEMAEMIVIPTARAALSAT